MRDWWTAEDNQRFNAEAKVFGDQYAKFEAVPGMFVNPALTMGENIADFAGISVALDAYHRSLGGKPAPVLDGLTGDQRFFLAFAQVWREKQRDDALKSQVTTDPHSPGRFRVLGPIRNVQAWYDAFGITPDNPMYIPPEKRAHIWWARKLEWKGAAERLPLFVAQREDGLRQNGRMFIQAGEAHPVAPGGRRGRTSRC